MLEAKLHDGSALEIEVHGEGPTLLLPVDPRPVEGPQADEMRKYGADPALGQSLVKGLRDAFRVVAFPYEAHVLAKPKPETLTPANVVADILAVADAAGAERFAYYGYSWLAMIGLQLALRSDRLSALVMGGFPPLGGPYAAMLAVTRSAHEQSRQNVDKPAGEPAPGDWDSAEVTAPPEQTGQYVTLYESLQGFDETEVHLSIPRFAFAGADDVIQYPAKWGHARVDIGPALAVHRAALEASGWEVAVLPGKDHMTAMHADVVREWLRDRR